MTAKERREFKQKRIENYHKNNDMLRPAEAAEMFPSFSVDYFYDHWQELGERFSKPAAGQLIFRFLDSKLKNTWVLKKKRQLNIF